MKKEETPSANRLRFRAWDQKMKEFIDSRMFAIGNNGEILAARYEGFPKWPTPQFEGFFEVDYEQASRIILMQSTGLLDKNGKEIFECDVVKYVRNPTIKKVINFGEIINDEYGLQGYGWNIVCSEEYEIIGNVYEKPDLLPTL